MGVARSEVGADVNRGGRAGPFVRVDGAIAGVKRRQGPWPCARLRAMYVLAELFGVLLWFEHLFRLLGGV